MTNNLNRYDKFSKELHSFIDETRKEIHNSSKSALAWTLADMVSISPVWTGAYLANFQIGSIHKSMKKIPWEKKYSPHSNVPDQLSDAKITALRTTLDQRIRAFKKLKLGKKLATMQIANTVGYAFGVEWGHYPAKKRYAIFSNGFKELRAIWALKRKK